jgi:hypothetical protein
VELDRARRIAVALAAAGLASAGCSDASALWTRLFGEERVSPPPAAFDRAPARPLPRAPATREVPRLSVAAPGGSSSVRSTRDASGAVTIEHPADAVYDPQHRYGGTTASSGSAWWSGAPGANTQLQTSSTIGSSSTIERSGSSSSVCAAGGGGRG